MGVRSAGWRYYRICGELTGWDEQKKSREGGLTALEGDLRKALGRNFLRWEKDNVRRTTACADDPVASDIK
jgi:hypothetical protein